MWWSWTYNFIKLLIFGKEKIWLTLIKSFLLNWMLSTIVQRIRVNFRLISKCLVVVPAHTFDGDTPCLSNGCKRICFYSLAKATINIKKNQNDYAVTNYKCKWEKIFSVLWHKLIWLSTFTNANLYSATEQMAGKKLNVRFYASKPISKRKEMLKNYSSDLK